MISPGTGAKRQRGFTLLELLVVLLIISLLVGLVPPLFSGAVPGAKLKAAVRDLAVTLRLARNQSITHDVETVVHINLEKPAYGIDKQTPQPIPAGIGLQVISEPGQIPFQSSRHLVRFYPDGSSSGTTIELRRDKRGYRVQVNWLTGRVTIEDSETDVY